MDKEVILAKISLSISITAAIIKLQLVEARYKELYEENKVTLEDYTNDSLTLQATQHALKDVLDNLEKLSLEKTLEIQEKVEHLFD